MENADCERADLEMPLIYLHGSMCGPSDRICNHSTVVSSSANSWLLHHGYGFVSNHDAVLLSKSYTSHHAKHRINVYL